MSIHFSEYPTTTATRTTTNTRDSTVLPSPLPCENTKEYSDNSKSYPSAVAKYKEVVQNSEMFVETLKELHRSSGTKFMVPTIGGKPLDLHRLFVEVTSRGGLEKVIRDRRWREVIVVFDFPTTITNASFVLRKYYLSLLHHYEQVYYFRERGPPTSTTASMAMSPINGSSTLQVQDATSPAHEKDTAIKQLPGNWSLGVHVGVDVINRSSFLVDQHSKICEILIFLTSAAESSELHPGCWVTGTIDRKFDNGYLVSVGFGSDKLKGLLYHIPLELQMSQSSNTSAVPRRRSRKESRLASRDPSHPKSNRSGYNFFFAEHYARLKPLHHGQEKAISKKIGHLWSQLTEAEKQVYQEKGLRDKERYRTEMLEYRRSSNASKPQ
ncbi:hypothetical protein HHK36_005901 [Tetracentron sinense]|uniref:High mobility group B protein 10 n=1 Tax=Tetracentron sinense TaxID=13715 RepID=A0A834ZW86_TETSI|nr:hypothetical protein HHK36_005901 [Tetracentron sinense]